MGLADIVPRAALGSSGDIPRHWRTRQRDSSRCSGRILFVSVVKRAVSVVAAGLLGLVVVGCASSQGTAVTGRPRATTGRSRGSSLQLATLPSIGTAYCRAEPSSGAGRFALGIRFFADAQSASVRFRAGRLTVDRNFGDPSFLHGRTSWFRFVPLRARRPRVLWLAAVAGGEDGYTIGIVRVAAGDCSSVDPPSVTVQVYPRRYAGQPPPPAAKSILRPPFGMFP